jgi:hypothetical protein
MLLPLSFLMVGISNRDLRQYNNSPTSNAGSFQFAKEPISTLKKQQGNEIDHDPSKCCLIKVRKHRRMPWWVMGGGGAPLEGNRGNEAARRVRVAQPFANRVPRARQGNPSPDVTWVGNHGTWGTPMFLRMIESMSARGRNLGGSTVNNPFHSDTGQDELLQDRVNPPEWEREARRGARDWRRQKKVKKRYENAQPSSGAPASPGAQASFALPASGKLELNMETLVCGSCGEAGHVLYPVPPGTQRVCARLRTL